MIKHLFLAAVVLISSTLTLTVFATPVHAATTATRIAQLPAHFGIGVKNSPGEVWEMPNAPWEYRYQYVNHDWKNWNSPAGAFVKTYAQQGHIPVFTWYVLGSSSCGYPQAGLFTCLQDASKMNGYYSDFVLAMQNAAASGVTPIIFQIEPDLWGFMQQSYGDDPTVIPVSVASSGYTGLGSLPNNAAGFAQALIQLRDAYAPDVILGIDVSTWGPNYYPTNGADPVASGNRFVNFYKKLNAPFDMLIHDPSDADSALKVIIRGQSTASAWWTDSSYASYRTFINTIYTGTGLKSMSWQVPVGNTLYKSQNNTTYHYQDNQVQYFLQAGNRQHIIDYVNAGMIGILFGGGQWDDTNYLDYSGDGITNPASINGNNLTATVSDDDGGFLRSSTAAYYASGPVPTTSSTPPSSPVPTVTISTNPTSVSSGQSSTLSWSSTNATSCTGSGFTANGTSGSVTVSPNATQTYSITCTGAGGNAMQSVTIIVSAISSTPPLATITVPASGAHYDAGDIISFVGDATDAQEGALSASAFSWTITFYHDTHTHPFLGPINGTKTGSFTIPRIGELSDNVWYRIALTVTDSTGLTHTVTRDVIPNKVDLTATSNPSGLQITLNGQPRTTPYLFKSVVGMQHQLDVGTPQTSGGQQYAFQNWSDGGARAHAITAPSTATSYAANFTTASAAITIGSRVITTANLNVRQSASPSAAKLGTQPIASLGTIIGGATTAGGHTWWQINYNTGVDGWSIGDYLTTVAASASPVVGMTAPSSSLTVSSFIGHLMLQVQSLMGQIQTLQVQMAGVGTVF